MPISFDEFKKVELKVAKVLTAERVEGSEKLLKLQVDLGADPSNPSGQDKRQIIAGVGTHYTPDQMIGREIIIVANLEPRTLMGLESQGMLLAAADDKPVLLKPDTEVPPGTGIR